MNILPTTKPLVLHESLGYHLSNGIMPLVSAVTQFLSVPSGEGVSGALWWRDLFSLAEEIGFSQPHLVTADAYDIDNPELKPLVGM